MPNGPCIPKCAVTPERENPCPMSLFLFLLVVQAVVAAALVGVILMQRSEGGGLGIGGSPSGMMSARGAAGLEVIAITPM